jgi:hypothetical protein
VALRCFGGPAIDNTSAAYQKVRQFSGKLRPTSLPLQHSRHHFIALQLSEIRRDGSRTSKEKEQIFHSQEAAEWTIEEEDPAEPHYSEALVDLSCSTLHSLLMETDIYLQEPEGDTITELSPSWSYSAPQPCDRWHRKDNRPPRPQRRKILARRCRCQQHSGCSEHRIKSQSIGKHSNRGD